MAKLETKTVSTAIGIIVFIIILFLAYSQIVPEAQTAGNSINASNYCVDLGCAYNATADANNPCRLSTNHSVICADARGNQGIPLSGLFGGSGIVFIIIMAALLIVIVKSLLKKK